MSVEAFANAEELAYNAFSLSDPAPALLNLIQKHPTPEAVNDLLRYYTEFVEENPSRAHVLASAFETVCNSPEAPSIGESSLAHLTMERLDDLHTHGFDPEGETFGPTNTYLITSLLSGLSFKHNLTSGTEEYGNIVEGLNAQKTSPTAEVRVIGACIQLLIDGSGIVTTADERNNTNFYSANEVALKLKAQKSMGTVKDPHALVLLERAISHAETGFKKENDMDNVWDLLFPSQA